MSAVSAVTSEDRLIFRKCVLDRLTGAFHLVRGRFAVVVAHGFTSVAIPKSLHEYH